MKTKPKAKPILTEAQELTSGERQRDYDHPKINHHRIATLWSAYLSIRPGGSVAAITPSDAAWMMLLTKIARHQGRVKRDNFVDVAGYARCLAMIEGLE